MTTWFTSDLHLGHASTIDKFIFRPFKDVNDMNRRLVLNWNERVKPGDTVYHLGDFCFKGSAKKYEFYFNGKIVHIRGNHDKNNGVKTVLTKVIAEFGGHEVLMQHVPPLRKEEIPEFCDMVLCGHVHEKWKHIRLDDMPDVPIINVGVEQWNYRPVSLPEILKYYDKIQKRYYQKNKGDE